MAPRKKPVDEAFRKAVIGALGQRKPGVVARENGLSGNAISRVIQGQDPQLSTAIRIVHAVGLEFDLHSGRWRKAPTVQPHEAS